VFEPVNELTALLDRHEDKGYITCANGELTWATIARIRKRSTPMRICWEKGHAGHILNEGADALAGEGARKPAVFDEEATTPNPGTAVRGVCLTSLTQSIAYRAIRREKMIMYSEHPRTKQQMELVSAAFNKNFERSPTTAAVFSLQVTEEQGVPSKDKNFHVDVSP
jgi:hypothetical protein